jgi:hypothetical protein
MRKTVSIVLTMIMISAGAESALLAAAQLPVGDLTGVARGGYMQTLGTMRVQLRNIQSGELVGATTTTEAGAFSFPGVPAGNYVVEIVDAAGKIRGVGAPVQVTAGSIASTSVIAPGIGGGAAAAGGFHLLGMGPVTSMSVLGAAAAASVTAVVATRPNASPSR